MTWEQRRCSLASLVECLGASLWDEEGEEGTLLSAAPPGRLGVSHVGNVLLCGGLLDFWGKFLWVWFYFLLQTVLSLD